MLKFLHPALLGSPWWPIAGLCTAVALLYAPFLTSPLVFDDVYLFIDPEVVRNYARTAHVFSLRWLPYASLSWTANWFGFDVIGFRLGNLFLHAANSIVLFIFLRRLFAMALNHMAEQQLIRSGWLAFLGALIFSLHPVAVYGVAYLIQRTILMATLFMLLMLLAYMQGLKHGGKRWFGLAALFYFLAAFSKEHAVMAPVIALALTLLLRQPSRMLFKQTAPFFLPAFIIALAVVLEQKGLLGTPYELYGQDMLRQVGDEGALEHAYLLSVMTQSYLYFKYLLLWVLPNPAWMSVDMREPFATSLLSWPQTAGLVVFLAYPCLAVWLLLRRGKSGLLGFAMLFPWILFLTELSTVRIQEPFVLYRSYLWMGGIFVAMPALWGWLETRMVYLVLIGASILMVPMALDRLSTFSHPFLLWDDAEKLVHGKQGLPGIDRIYYNRGTELIGLQRYEEAIADFNRGLAANPKLDHLYGNRGSAYLQLDKYPEALRDYDKAIALNAGNSKYYYGRGLILQRMNDIEAARINFQKSCELANRGCDKLQELSQRVSGS